MPPRIPRNKQFVNPTMELLDPMVAALMDPEKERLTNLLERLILSNQKLGGTMNAFYHLGIMYSVISVHHLRGIQVKNLDPALVHEFEVYLEDRDRYETDRKKLSQALSVVLPKCRSLQAIRDALPEALVGFIPQLRGMERMDPEGFLLRSNPMLHEQFKKASDIALYYIANRMVY